MATSKDDKADKVFDVTKPGKTAASASSRPLIVGHKTMLKDPMMKDEPVSELDEDKSVKIDKPIEEDTPSGSPLLPATEEEVSSEDNKITVPSVSKIKIEPLSGTESDDKPAADDKVVVKGESKANTKNSVKISAKAGGTAETQANIAEDKDTTEIEPDSEKDNTEAKDDTSPEAEPGETSTDENQNQSDDKSETTAATERKKVDKETQEMAAHNEQLEKLIVDKQYFVPIGEKTRKKRSLRHILVGIILILLMGIVLADLMIDVGIIKTSIKPPVSVFHSKNSSP